MKRILSVFLSLALCLVVFSGCGGNSSSSKKGSSTNTNHKCYVCGETGNVKYEGEYYCPTHYAYVKTVVENQ